VQRKRAIKPHLVQHLTVLHEAGAKVTAARQLLERLGRIATGEISFR